MQHFQIDYATQNMCTQNNQLAQSVIRRDIFTGFFFVIMPVMRCL